MGVQVIEVLLREERFVVVQKPAKMPVHATRGAVGRPLLQTLRDQLGQKIWLVHRLDAATSGALVVALDAEAAGRLSELFRTGEVTKRYLALVRGRPETAGLIDHPVPSEDGERKPAQTLYRPLAGVERYGWLALGPRTGRRHQLRRHLKHMSWPILGDVRYGKGEHNRRLRDSVGLERLALHAGRIAFEDSELGGVDVKAPLPADLFEPLERLGIEARWLGPEAVQVELVEPDPEPRSDEEAGDRPA